MKKIELEIVALSHSITTSSSYAVVLGEVGGARRLPIVIGSFEAQAIAVALENVKPSRPLTHDLIKNFMGSFGVELQEILISDLQEGIFYSKLVCYSENDTIEIDSRTSDALALSVRFNCPIYIYDNILEASGILIDEQQSGSEKIESITIDEKVNPSEDNLSNMSISELQHFLETVLEKEDYLKAISIRDEINRRKK